ncbi:MAG: ArgE/DapE family deacylase [Candidatus Competibacterales bacterium]
MIDLHDFQTSILDQVEAGFAHQVAFTQQLIRFPSLRGQEHTIQDFLYGALAARGLTMDRWTTDPDLIRHHPGYSPVAVDYQNAINVVGSHRPQRETGRSLILNGHVDVVPTGPAAMWRHPPFEPHIEGDWLYGRGSGDMKAGLAANLFALDAIRRAGFDPAATLHLQSVTEEESTGNGTLSALVRGYRADAALIPEPEDDQLVRANVGVIWLKVHLKGKPVHVREAQTGASAILAAWTIIHALQDLEATWNARKDKYRHFQDQEHPININIGKIEGGDWASSVPSWCTLHVRAALYPGVDPVDAAGELEAAIAAASAKDTFLARHPPEVEYNGFFTQGYILEEGSAAEATLARAFAAVHDGRALQAFVTPGYLDGRVFVLYGDCPCLVYGPLAENIHGVDERVHLGSLLRVTKTIALFIAHWCGLEERSPTESAVGS